MMSVWNTSRPTAVILIMALGLTLLALPGFHWVVTFGAFICVSVLAAIQAPIVVAAVVVSIPVQSEVMLPFIVGGLTLTQLLLFGLIAGWASLFWRRRIWLDSVVVGFMLVLAAYAISFIAVDDPGLWLQESYRWAVAGVFYVICRSVITSWQHIRWVVWAMTAGVAGVSLFALYQLVGATVPSHLVVGGSLRVFATFGTPNTLAAYIEFSVPLLFACLLMTWMTDTRKIFSTLELLVIGSSASLGLLIIGLTQSRGGWIGMAAACLILWIHIPGKIKWSTAAVAVIAIGGFLLTSAGQSQLRRFDRVLSDDTTEMVQDDQVAHETGVGRDSIWGAAFSMIQDKPLTGVGAGEFDENFREYVREWRDRFPRGQAHNVWLQMAAQAGIGGVVAYSWWYAASMWSIITARRRVHSREYFWIITGVIAVFTAYTLHSLVDYLNVLSLGLQLSVVTAIALNLAPEPLTRYSDQADNALSIISSEAAPCPQ